METRILEELQKIEETENVKIMMAVESGSRAWGFESPDSDYDVRFIYIRKQEDYLKLEGIRDVIEWKLDETLDINGWDLKKALQLLYKSNPTIFEWCASPIVYFSREEFTWLKELLPEYFSVKKSLYHYLRMAERNYKTYLKFEDVQVKKYLYVLRPLLAAKWIAEKKSAPPVLFEELAEAELENELKAEMEKLLEIKKITPEVGTIPKIQKFHDYVEKTLSEIKEAAETAEEKTKEWEKLNQMFLKMIFVNDIV